MIMERDKAEVAGYHALTFTYRVPEELGMLDRALGDLRRGNISHVLVQEEAGFSVWRRGAGASATSRRKSE